MAVKGGIVWDAGTDARGEASASIRASLVLAGMLTVIFVFLACCPYGSFFFLILLIYLFILTPLFGPGYLVS